MADPEQSRRFLDAIRRNANRLGRLIADLLDLSRIDAGTYPLELRGVVLASLARSVHKCVGEACRARSAELVIEIDPGLEVWADAAALEHVLVGLVENAIDSGPEGGTIELVAVPCDDGIRIEVRDRGPSIAALHQRHAFESFYRVDPARSVGGTGLGLAIVARLVIAMQGDVGVEGRSEEVGACYWVRLPKRETEAGQ